YGRPLDSRSGRRLGARADARQGARPPQGEALTTIDEAATRPRAALVTGAAQRIGRVIALALAADGWAVAVHYRASRAAAEALVAEIERAGGRAVALAADLGDESAAAGLVPQAVAGLGPLGCLVNNASSFEN